MVFFMFLFLFLEFLSLYFCSFQKYYVLLYCQLKPAKISMIMSRRDMFPEWTDSREMRRKFISLFCWLWHWKWYGVHYESYLPFSPKEPETLPQKKSRTPRSRNWQFFEHQIYCWNMLHLGNSPNSKSKQCKQVSGFYFWPETPPFFPPSVLFHHFKLHAPPGGSWSKPISPGIPQPHAGASRIRSPDSTMPRLAGGSRLPFGSSAEARLVAGSPCQGFWLFFWVRLRLIAERFWRTANVNDNVRGISINRASYVAPDVTRICVKNSISPLRQAIFLFFIWCFPPPTVIIKYRFLLPILLPMECQDLLWNRLKISVASQRHRVFHQKSPNVVCSYRWDLRGQWV